MNLLKHPIHSFDKSLTLKIITLIFIALVINKVADSIKTQITAINDAIKNLKRLDDAVNKDTLNSYIADAKTKTNEDLDGIRAAIAELEKALSSVNKIIERDKELRTRRA